MEFLVGRGERSINEGFEVDGRRGDVLSYSIFSFFFSYFLIGLFGMNVFFFFFFFFSFLESYDFPL